MWKSTENTANQEQILRQLMIHFGLKIKNKNTLDPHEILTFTHV